MMLLAAILFLQSDGSPPSIVSVTARGDATRIVVVFSKPVDAASSERAAGYAVDPGVKVESASRGSDLRTVTLATSPLAEGVAYTLRVAGVRDCSTPPLEIAAAEKPFTFSKGLFSGPARPESRAPRMPKFSRPVLFNTPEADAILSALQVFPKNNAWNEDISKRPVHPDSERMIAAIGRDKTLRPCPEMGFVLVPPNQPRVEVKIRAYPAESDPGPYPVPDNSPVQGWPFDGRSLEASQQGAGDRGEDRHMMVVDPVNGFAYEFYRAFRRPGGWEADVEATFDLKSNALRPKNWTSGDAAGLSMFASLPRYDECERGIVPHALRFTVARTRRAFVYPATHQAGSTDAPDAPAMGQRFRLKASVDVSGFPKHAQAIALGLKKHGMFVADNGADWDFCVPPDARLKGIEALRKLKGGDFEVVVTTGENDLGR
jgi:hypothetical protein